MYLVKREVYATNIEQAVKAKGVVYEIQLAEEKYQNEKQKTIGFKKVEKNK